MQVVGVVSVFGEGDCGAQLTGEEGHDPNVIMCLTSTSMCGVIAGDMSLCAN